MASDGNAIDKPTPVQLQDMMDECIRCNVPLHVNYPDLQPMERAWVRMICCLIDGYRPWVKKKQVRCAQCPIVVLRTASIRGTHGHHIDRAQRAGIVEALALELHDRINMSPSTRTASTQGGTASSSEMSYANDIAVLEACTN